MPLPDNVGYSLVKGRLIRSVVDGSDSDKYPDSVPVAGAKVVFTPSVYKVVNSSAPEPVIIIMDPIIASTDYDGYLVSPDGEKILYLVASDDPDLNPTNFTYKVTITAKGLTAQTWNMTAPEGALQDLATLVPVPPKPGEDIAEWQSAVDAVWQAQDDAVALIEQTSQVGANTFRNKGNASSLDLSEEAHNAIVHATLTAAAVPVTLPSSPMVGHTITLILTQDSDGSRGVVINGAKTSMGQPITPSAVAGSTTEIQCFFNGQTWTARLAGSKDAVPSGWSGGNSSTDNIPSSPGLMSFLDGGTANTLDLSSEKRSLCVDWKPGGSDVSVVLPEVPVVGQVVVLSIKSIANASLTIPGARTALGLPIGLTGPVNSVDEVQCFWDGSSWKARLTGKADVVPNGWEVL